MPTFGSPGVPLVPGQSRVRIRAVTLTSPLPLPALAALVPLKHMSLRSQDLVRVPSSQQVRASCRGNGEKA